MPRLVAFLRGINVGGHTAKKEIFQEAFVSLGLQNVSTFRQSGNIVFEGSSENSEQIKSKIGERLREALGFEVEVFIRTIQQLKSIVEGQPFGSQKPAGSSFLVTFLPCAVEFPFALPITIPKSTAQIIAAIDSEVYSVTHGGGEGALPNPYVEKTLKVKATTRNLNVIKEIVEKYG